MSISILESNGSLWIRHNDKCFLMEQMKVFESITDPVWQPSKEVETPNGKFIPLKDSNYVNAGFHPEIRLVSKIARPLFVNFNEVEEQPKKKKTEKKKPNLIIDIPDDVLTDETPLNMTKFWGDDEKTIEYLGPLSPKETQNVQFDETYLDHESDEYLDIKKVPLTRQTAV
jgi:hypothetical protein